MRSPKKSFRQFLPTCITEVLRLSRDEVHWVTSAFETTGGHELLILDELIVGLRDGLRPEEFFGSLESELSSLSYRRLAGTPDEFIVQLDLLAGHQIRQHRPYNQ
jgi:hypothetical protein